MPTLETERLTIRPLVMDDLPAVHRLLDVELAEADFGGEGAQNLEARRAWLEWTVMSYDQYGKLYQPPYGERAIALKQTGELLGLVGFVPCLNQFEQLPGFSNPPFPPGQSRSSTEFGLFYALSPAHQRQGYATEAAQALIKYGFGMLKLRRIVATTTYDNPASMAVMRKLGMRLEKNPHSGPPWLQVVGVIDFNSSA